MTNAEKSALRHSSFGLDSSFWFRHSGLLLLSLFLLLLRLGSYHEPPEWDIGTYQAIAREMLNGERLYADAWDVKPPGVFVAYLVAQGLVGDGALPIYLLSVTCAIVTMWGICFAARRMAGAGMVAALFWVAMCFEPGTGANLPNTEVFINACVAWAMALWFGADDERFSWRRVVAIGLLFGVASLFKQVAIVILACIPMVDVFFTWLGRPARENVSGCAANSRAGCPSHVMCAIVGLSVVGLVWVGVMAYFAATGRAWLAWQTFFVAPRAYSGGMVNNLVASLTPGRMFSTHLLFAFPAMALTVVALITHARRRLLVGLLVGTHLAVALPGQFFPHYYQLWFVPLAIGAGWGAAALPRSIKRPRLAYAVVGLALVAMIAPQMAWYALDGRGWAKRKHGDFYLYAHDAFKDADRMLAPGETFYSWNDEAYGYAITARRPPATALWKMHTTTGPLAEWLTRRTLDELDRAKPRLVILYGENPQPAAHPILEWTRQHYDPLPGENRRHFPLFLYVRKESETADERR
jgi:hypothetical protein